MSDRIYEVPHCEAFSGPQPHTLWAQIFASRSCFQIPLACTKINFPRHTISENKPYPTETILSFFFFGIVEDDVKLTGNHIRTIERNADVLLNACKDIGVEVNTGKTKYTGIGRQRGMIANEHFMIW